MRNNEPMRRKHQVWLNFWMEVDLANTLQDLMGSGVKMSDSVR